MSGWKGNYGEYIFRIVLTVFAIGIISMLIVDCRNTGRAQDKCKAQNGQYLSGHCYVGCQEVQ